MTNPNSTMHVPTRSITWTKLLPPLVTGILLIGLPLLSTGCGGTGANGNGDGQQDTTPPDAPSGLTTDAGAAQVTLDWEGVSDADSYSVYRTTEPTDEVSGSALNTGLPSTTYTDESAENGTTYFYRVTAVDTAGNESTGSGEAQGTPFTPPSELEGTSGDSQVELQWSTAEGAETYNVYRSTSSTSGAEGSPLTTGVSGTSYTDDSAENGTKYYYRITSVNPENEESTASGELEKTPFDGPPDRP